MATDYTLHEGFPNLRLQEGMQVRLNAINPTTGAEVTGVVSSRWSIYGDDTGDNATGLEDVVPLLTAQAGQ